MLLSLQQGWKLADAYYVRLPPRLPLPFFFRVGGYQLILPARRDSLIRRTTNTRGPAMPPPRRSSRFPRSTCHVFLVRLGCREGAALLSWFDVLCLVNLSSPPSPTRLFHLLNLCSLSSFSSHVQAATDGLASFSFGLPAEVRIACCSSFSMAARQDRSSFPHSSLF